MRHLTITKRPCFFKCIKYVFFTFTLQIKAIMEQANACQSHIFNDVPDIDALGKIVRDFRQRYTERSTPINRWLFDCSYHDTECPVINAVDSKADQLDRDWDLLWAQTTQNTIADAMQPDADIQTIQSRLAALLRHWRRAMLDLVRLYSCSLHLQEVVHAGMARIEAWRCVWWGDKKRAYYDFWKIKICNEC